MAAKQVRRRGSYTKPLRTQAMIEVRRRVVIGETYDQIMRDLRIP
jgi:hypothetical protein